ncbi:TolC family protein [Rhizorhabdus dicambivorans]|uniref:TolC family protein n=1 Tax=Rhizorhabdus dicambivorans TaxID=1850238 RepID=UPI0022AA7833|nr:TolC family protein [Rhizorhabdus dicambivorans]
MDNFPVSGPPAGSFVEDSMTMARVGISQDVPNAAKRHARTSRARTDVEAAEATLLSERRRVEVATALAWIDLAYAERRLAALDGILSKLAPFPPRQRAASPPAPRAPHRRCRCGKHSRCWKTAGASSPPQWRANARSSRAGPASPRLRWSVISLRLLSTPQPCAPP